MANLADRIMDFAARSAPRNRTAWAEAMQAEYVELQRGRLSWALGCWLAVTGWRLRADASYFAVLALVALVLPIGWPIAFMGLLRRLLLLQPAWAFYAEVMLGPALACLALGAYRPRRVMVPVAVIQATGLAFVWICAAWAGRPFHSPWDMVQQLNIMNQPFVLGLSIWIGTDLVCAWLGGRLRQRFAPLAS